MRRPRRAPSTPAAARSTRSTRPAGSPWSSGSSAEHPDLFKLLRNATYLAYYESPAVIRAIQALGQPYRAMPGRDGYPLPPFDLERDRPRHGRGHYVPTDEVRRVDLSGLDHWEASDGRA